jgi:hypothetical protein
VVAAALLVPVLAFAQRPPPPEPPPLFPPTPQVFLSVALGTGSGVIGGRTEAIGADVATGAQWAPMHGRVELAAFRNPQLAFAISARVGYSFADVGDPPKAKAVMLRVYRMCSPLGLRFNGAIGAGYIRYRVGVDGTAKDTMAAGPVIAGGGVGYVLPLYKQFHVTIDLNAYAAIASSENYGGVPNEHALHFDLDLGLAVFR